MTAKVAKSNSELIGPKRIMNRRMNAMSQCEGRTQLLLVDVVGGDGHLAGVVEQVVEQDLGRQHRQERQERGGDGDAEHVAEVDDVPISTYLMVLAKIRRPSATPSASTSRSFRAG